MNSAVPRLSARSVVHLLGDLHLGDGAGNEGFSHGDRLLAEFLDSCPATCDAVVFMGDAVDLPQAWTVRRVLAAHPLVAGAISRLCQRLPVFFLAGNHDWTVDYERIFPGARRCERLLLGEALVWHGHQLDPYCQPGLLHRLETTIHHLVERYCGFRFRVPLDRYDSWQNRVSHWLGHKYGRHLLRMSLLYRLLGLNGRAAACDDFIAYWSRSVWGDSNALFDPAATHLAQASYPALVCGHSHLPGVVALEGRHYVNAGSWTEGSAQLATWDGSRFVVQEAASGVVIDDDNYSWMLRDPDPGDFFSWWTAHYRGWLRFQEAAPR